MKENLVDDKKVEHEVDEDEEEDGEEDEEEHVEEGDDSLDFLQNFPNFYSMAADIMNQLDGEIPEVHIRHIANLMTFWSHLLKTQFELGLEKNIEPDRFQTEWEKSRRWKSVAKSSKGAAYKEQLSDCSWCYNRGQSIKLNIKQCKGDFYFVLSKQ